MFASLWSWLSRAGSAVLLGGRVILFLIAFRFDRRQTHEQLILVGPESLLIALITSGCIGMIFTIQVASEFLKLGASTTVGGVLGIAMARELSPIITAVVVAARVGAAYAAELGTMRVTEQIDALYTLKTDPVEYLVVPRALACCIMVPILSILSLVVGMLGGLFLANAMFSITPLIFLNSIQNFLGVWDLVSGPIKGIVFGIFIAIIGCNWGLTTRGGAKGVGQSTTAAVVTAILAIIVSNFFLSWVMFGGNNSSSTFL
ncbi:MAG: MlaE family lipid ABC transporter permease subunit [Cyanobacteria bacterium P01_H01_bin.15]